MHIVQFRNKRLDEKIRKIKNADKSDLTKRIEKHEAFRAVIFIQFEIMETLGINKRFLLHFFNECNLKAQNH